MLKLFSYIKKKAFVMFKYIFIPAILMISACTATDIGSQPNTVSSRTVTTNRTAITPKKAAAPQTTANIFYDPKVADYIKKNQAASTLRAVAPEFAHKILAPRCTVEKFVSGLNSPQTEIKKISTSSIEIKTIGNKIGNGAIKITAQGKEAQISSAVIGKFQRTEADVLNKFAQSICNKVDEALK